jgi:lathosterol oxidase
MTGWARIWNHLPDLPIQVMPLFQKPPDLGAALRWYWASWFPISVNVGIVGLAFASLALTAPSLDEAATPGVWIALIWLRNLVLVFLLAHGLHLALHRYRLQGSAAKYDPRPYPRQGRMFTFGHQLYDNMFWAIASGVTIWSGFEALILWSMANGFAPVWNWEDGRVWYIAVFFLIPIWESAYFFWIHRLLHTDLFYRFHRLHHRNSDVGPWSGLSMHPVEHLLYFGTAAIHFVVPTAPVHVICHLMFFGLYAITTHAGFEGLWRKGRKVVHLGNFHHQLHHRFFEVNYGTLEIPFDIAFGSFHDGTEAAHERLKARLKERSRQ